MSLMEDDVKCKTTTLRDTDSGRDRKREHMRHEGISVPLISFPLDLRTSLLQKKNAKK